jgi:3-phenylpropionate/trans-cinnamate dioxygenase ferredoxin reductase component
VEHEDNANRLGRAAGRAMAGEVVRYDHSPMFYSDLFDLGYEAVGELDARLETVIYYLEERCVRGVLLWNAWGQVEVARALIAAGHLGNGHMPEARQHTCPIDHGRFIIFGWDALET